MDHTSEVTLIELGEKVISLFTNPNQHRWGISEKIKLWKNICA